MARKILLADDSVTAQNMGRKILADAGYEVVTVNNGSAALKRVHELKPDLVVLDIYMPGYSGLEVCQLLKSASDTAHIPVLLSVGKLEPFKVDEARRVRADAHIVKPFEASELLKAIGQLADRMLPASETAAPASPAAKTRAKAETTKEVANDPAASPENSTSGANHLRRSVEKTKEREKTESAVTSTEAFHDFRNVPATPNQSEVASAEQREHTATQQASAAQASEIPSDITPDELDALSALVAQLGTPPTSGKRATADSGKSAMPAATTSELRAPDGVVDPVNITQFSQEPASIDQQDEPIFAVKEYTGSRYQPKAVAASAELPAEAARADEPKAGESAAGPSRFETTQAQSSRMESARAKSAEIPATDIQPTGSQATEFECPKADVHETVPDADSAVPVESELRANYATAHASESEQVTAGEIESRDAAPADEKSSEEELAKALRALTQAGSRAAHPLYPMEMPAVFNSSSSSTVSSSTAMSSTTKSNDNQALATSPRWTAEPVPVEAEEAAASLEAEMFAGLANKAAQEALSAPGAGMASANIESTIVESTILENKIMEAAMPAEISHEAQKAMAAAATADGASSSLADAGTVANIVDRVLAELRPKIVEEITRKLGGK